MKKRIFALFLAVILCTALFPAAVSADEISGNINTDPISLTSENSGGNIDTDPIPIPDDSKSLFPDVDWDAYYAEAVKWLNEHSIITGYDSGLFGVGDVITRGQFATIIYRAFGFGQKMSDRPFPDVEENKFYTDAASWVNSKGYMTGYDSGEFGPNDSLTREQLVTVFYRMYCKLHGEPELYSSYDGFKDAAKVSAFASSAMKWAVQNNIIKGTNEGCLLPTDPCTREQAATIIYRCLMSGLYNLIVK